MKLALITRLCLVFLLCKVFPSCSDKNVDCNRFKTGKFIYHNLFEKHNFIITRTDSIQTNVDEGTGWGSKSKIEWLGPCEYRLTPLSLIVNGRDSAIGNLQDFSGNSLIVESAEKYCITETKIEGEQGIHRDTIWIKVE